MDNIEFALKRFDAPLILDEAQILPDIFPVLRSIVDSNRQENGQYFLLGSVNPEQVKRISESLAGRVGIIELTPLLYSELAAIKKIDFSHYWLIVDRGNEHLGYEFKCSLSVEKKDWRNLKAGLEEGIIHKATVVYMGERNYPVADDIEVVNAEDLLITNGPMT